ncbi:MAG: NUDIX domain-containing protein [Planctomycetota bacterium]
MHRRAVLQLIDRCVATFPGDADQAARIRSLVEAHVDCFERTCMPGHITGSAWITSYDFSQCLLTHHKKLGKWLQLGGHADGEQHVERVAFQEAVEESGLQSLELLSIGEELTPLDLDVHLIPARTKSDGTDEPEHEHHDLRFLLLADPAESLTVSEESHDLAWVPADQLEDYTREISVLRLRDKASDLASRLRR